jgi:hypothetical protein
MKVAIGVILFGVCFWLPAPAGAQGSIFGSVLDQQTENPIASAEVTLLDRDGRALRTIYADDLGAFAFPRIGSGVYRLRAGRIGYLISTSPLFELIQTDTLHLVLRLDTEAVPLAPLEVTARARRRASPVLEDFRFRMNRGTGHFISREAILARSPFYVTDVLAMVPGVRVGNPTPQGGRHVSMTRTPAHLNCHAQIYLDGTLVNPPMQTAFGGTRRTASINDFSIDEVVSPASVEGIEVYRGLSEVPAEFMSPYAICGVIAVWTRRGDTGR